ncbi:uncharacterized protein LOC122244479, partial [Penaeus japonicus]|uniref:uncharacterized protein LOC122244479 n=1 Tax=Penaeus japonicus TaxID=27405 RepID=UPI001C7115D7
MTYMILLGLSAGAVERLGLNQLNNGRRLTSAADMAKNAGYTSVPPVQRGLSKFIKILTPNTIFLSIHRSIKTRLVWKAFGYVHVCVGDLLKNEVKNPDSAVGRLIKEQILSNTIVSWKVTCPLLERYMK